MDGTRRSLGRAARRVGGVGWVEGDRGAFGRWCLGPVRGPRRGQCEPVLSFLFWGATPNPLLVAALRAPPSVGFAARSRCAPSGTYGQARTGHRDPPESAAVGETGNRLVEPEGARHSFRTPSSRFATCFGNGRDRHRVMPPLRQRTNHPPLSAMVDPGGQCGLARTSPKERSGAAAKPTEGGARRAATKRGFGVAPQKRKRQNRLALTRVGPRTGPRGRVRSANLHRRTADPVKRQWGPSVGGRAGDSRSAGA